MSSIDGIMMQWCFMVPLFVFCIYVIGGLIWDIFRPVKWDMPPPLHGDGRGIKKISSSENDLICSHCGRLGKRVCEGCGGIEWVQYR